MYAFFDEPVFYCRHQGWAKILLDCIAIQYKVLPQKVYLIRYLPIVFYDTSVHSQ